MFTLLIIKHLVMAFKYTVIIDKFQGKKLTVEIYEDRVRFLDDITSFDVSRSLIYEAFQVIKEQD